MSSKEEKMKKIILWLMLMAMPLQGCSIYKAATAAPPVEVDNVKVGSTRPTLLATLGTPKMTEVSDDQRTDVFEFISGHHGASKARILLYLAGDFFTLGLAELVFWPMELALLQGKEGRVVASYGSDDVVQKVLLLKKDGSAW